MKEACGMAVKVLSKTMDSTKLSSEKSKLYAIYGKNCTDDYAVEFATVGKTKDGRIYHHLWGADEITTLLKEHNLARDEPGADGDRIIS